MDCGYECPHCYRVFTQRKSLLRHLRTACKPYLQKNPEVKERQDAEALRNRTCPVCMKVFSQRSNMLTHQSNVCSINQRSAFDAIFPVAVPSTSTNLSNAPQQVFRHGTSSKHVHTAVSNEEHQQTTNGTTSFISPQSAPTKPYPFCISTTLQQNIEPLLQFSNQNNNTQITSNSKTNDNVVIPDQLKCPDCGRNVSDKYKLQRHKVNSCKARDQQTLCPDCGLLVPEKRIHIHGLKECSVARTVGGAVQKGDEIKLRREDGVWESQSAYNNMLTNYTIENTEEIHDPKLFLESKRRIVYDIVKQDLQVKYAIKMNLVLQITIENTKCETSSWALRTVNREVFMDTDGDEIISEMYDILVKKFSEKLLDGSGCRMLSIENLEMRTNRFIPLRGSSYIQIPKGIAGKHAVINPQNNDNNCFRYSVCVSQALHENHPERVTVLNKYMDRFNWDGLSKNVPVAISDIRKFERNNPKVSVGVYGLSKEKFIYEVFPIKHVPDERETHIDLLFMEEEGRQHYAYIKDFDRLVSNQLSKHHATTRICKRCLTVHQTLENLREHQRDCNKNPVAKVVMPEPFEDKEGNIMQPIVEFKNWQHSTELPIVIYADLEAALMDVQGPPNDPYRSSTTKVQQHEAMSYCFFVQTTLPPEKMVGVPLEPQIYRGEKAAARFLQQLEEVSRAVKKIYKDIEPINLTTQEEETFQEATECYFCSGSFTKEDYKVRDHCHVTGQFRGPAHNSCNLNARQARFIPVLMHNLSGYDSHFIVRELGNSPGSVQVIPNSEEKFIAFSKTPENGVKLQFIDTYRFMPSSLDTLAKDLAEDDAGNESYEKFNNVGKFFPDPKHKKLLSQKGVFCYDYVSDLKKLETTELPPKEEFHSKLYDEPISDKEYQHAKTVWNTFKCKDLGEYSDLYLKSDVLLLADVFEAFRKMCMDEYNLDPCWYFTTPALAWDASLKQTRQQLELIQDPEILYMVEKGVRGGVAQCSKRYAEAKNKYTEGVDVEDPEYIAYLDANNLYGWAMSQPLPTGNFKLKKNENSCELDEDWLKKQDTSQKKGYILEVDVEYPGELHDEHSDLPFLPESKVPPGSKHPKLLTTLHKKENYVVHVLALKQAVAHGLKVTKVHKVLEFDQSPWLKSYIDNNTRRRQQARNAFEKAFFKLMNNAVYGKTMENVRRRIDMELVILAKRLKKCIASPFFKDRTIYSETLCAVHFHKKKVYMNKPIYVGMCILDLSKTLMYEFHYDFMLKKYGKKLSLLYMDTDSFLYHIQTEDFYQDIRMSPNESPADYPFDTSDYPKDHPCYSEHNKKVLGKFKDEANSVPVTHFVGLRAKMYAMKYGGKVTKRAKGVKRVALKKQIAFDDYVSCLRAVDVKYTNFRTFRSYKHQVFTIQQSKLSLSSHDDKRYILPDNINTLPHGHYKIPELEAASQDVEMMDV